MVRLCGTFGCALPDLHKGLHEVTIPLSRRKKTRPFVEKKEKIEKDEIVDICHVDDEVIAASKEPIQSTIGLHIVRKYVKVLWDGSDLVDGRSRWFKGTVVAFKPKTRVFLVHYRDGDKRWERIFDKHGMLLSRCKMS